MVGVGPKWDIPSNRSTGQHGWAIKEPPKKSNVFDCYISQGTNPVIKFYLFFELGEIARGDPNWIPDNSVARLAEVRQLKYFSRILRSSADKNFRK